MKKEKEIVLKENDSLKTKIVLKEKEKISKKKNSSSYAHVSSSKINDDICILKKSIDCLGSTLSQCAFKHNKLELIFHKKHVPHVHTHQPTR